MPCPLQNPSTDNLIRCAGTAQSLAMRSNILIEILMLPAIVRIFTDRCRFFTTLLHRYLYPS